LAADEVRGFVLRRIVFGLTIILIVGFGLRMSGVSIGMPHREEASATYITAAVERGNVNTTLSATGSLDALVTVEVGSQLSGQIAELLVDFNDEVKKGELLARLDPRSFEAEVREAAAALEVARAQVLTERATLQTAAAELAAERSKLEVAQAQAESARAKLTEAERDLQRKQALAGTETLAQAHVDQATTAFRSAAADLRAAEAGAEVAKEAVVAAEARQLTVDANLLYAQAAERQKAAELDQAGIDLARTVISAPIDGVVIGRDVDRGQTVAASLEAPTLFTIAQDLRQMEVHASIDEADIGRIRLGQQARFTVDAYPDRVFEGTVTQIRKAPQLIQNVVTYTVVLSTRNADLALLPGMTAIVRVVVDEAKDVLKVSNAALRFQPPSSTGAVAAAAGVAPDGARGAVVWVPGGDGVPVPVKVTLGRSNDSATEIVDGPLQAGQQVVVGTASILQDHSWLGFSWRL
jgi:HlyD family secretion protein